MDTTAVAAWVQAIGSIFAILVAIQISSKQFSDATTLQRRSFKEERGRKYRALLGLIDAALDDFSDVLKALQGDKPDEFFERTSAADLMNEFYEAFVQISPLDMPSGTAVRALVTLRDRLKAAAWNANEAITYDVGSDGYLEAVAAMESNLQEVLEERESLRAEFGGT
jgi:hypothetical protein